MSLLIVGLDNTIVNVALPSIGRELHATVSGLQWTVDAYTLVLASLLMLSGSMADRLGRRLVFKTGLALFTLGSLLCSLAPSLGALIAFRMLQAIGGSMLNPVAMSIIRNVFSDARERAQAIGMWGATVGISLALGPVVGGAIVKSGRNSGSMGARRPLRALGGLARAGVEELGDVGEAIVEALHYGVDLGPHTGRDEHGLGEVRAVHELGKRLSELALADGRSLEDLERRTPFVDADDYDRHGVATSPADWLPRGRSGVSC